MEHLDPAIPGKDLVAEARSCDLVTFLICSEGSVTLNTGIPGYHIV